MRRLLNMMLSVGLYAEKFEEPFIADSRRFFLAEGQVKNVLCFAFVLFISIFNYDLLLHSQYYLLSFFYAVSFVTFCYRCYRHFTNCYTFSDFRYYSH
jgi:hypothetical protein